MLGCAESTIYRWFKKYQKQGLEGLLAIKISPGRPTKIGGTALRELHKQLKTSTGFGSYGEIQEWLAKEHRLETAYSTVHGTVRYRLQVRNALPLSSRNYFRLGRQLSSKRLDRVVVKQTRRCKRVSKKTSRTR